MEELFKRVLMLLVEEGHVHLDDYFVDGTKIEANANWYTFVWKKSAENYKKKLETKVDQLIKHIDEITAEEETKSIITSEKIKKKCRNGKNAWNKSRKIKN
ncbi:hypothetical protein [Aneurinibacillus aneurinilyticus]|uniref:hypothetical protein n=1 Tax=Aneurinibacillus aneurinilyticus TaxID=1391 RepID=UPI00041F16CA